MSDGCAKGSLRCALGVEVNVLMIAGGIGELINSLLVYLNPVGKPDLFAYVVLQLACVNCVAHWLGPVISNDGSESSSSPRARLALTKLAPSPHLRVSRGSPAPHQDRSHS